MKELGSRSGRTLPRLKDSTIGELATVTGAKNRGIIARYDLTGLNFSEIPSVFIEMGYMTNPPIR